MSMKVHDNFLIGANYWSRNHGPAMWRDWHPDEIEQELNEIHNLGMNVIRIFLTWNDFQPIKEYYASNRSEVPLHVCLRHDESQTVKNNPHLMDFTMVDRFDQFLTMAEKYRFKVIPALLVGFMGGITFDVDFRDGRSLYTDPTMLYYQELYFSFFAKRYHDNNTILSWQFGNEMAGYEVVKSPLRQRLWMNTLINAIRRYDKTHPISPGDEGFRHSGRYKNGGSWYHHINVEMCDLLNVHTYPVFMPETKGGTLSLRTTYCASWRSRVAAGNYGLPVLTEEISSIGTSIQSDDSAAKWTRVTLFSLLGNGDSGMLWWTNSDMTCHQQLPYCYASTNASEHGGISLLDTAGKPKLQAGEFRKFSDLMSKIDFGKLEKQPAKAALIHSSTTELNSQEKRGISLAAFVTCKAAGLDVDLIDNEDSFEPYQLLICPSYEGLAPIFYKDERRIDQFVKNGGTLYLSMAHGCWERFEPFCGIQLANKHKTHGPLSLQIAGSDITIDFPAAEHWETETILCGAEVVATDQSGKPAVIMNRYGKGKVFLALHDFEKILGDSYDNHFDMNRLFYLYRAIRNEAGIAPAATSENPWIEICDCGAYLILINHGAETASENISLSSSITGLIDASTGRNLNITENSINAAIPPFAGIILERQP